MPILSPPLNAIDNGGNTQYKLKTGIEFLSYLNEKPLTELEDPFIRALARAKLDKGVEFMTLENIIDDDFIYYTKLFSGKKDIALMSFNGVFNDFNKYTKIVIEYLTVNTE